MTPRGALLCFALLLAIGLGYFALRDHTSKVEGTSDSDLNAPVSSIHTSVDEGRTNHAPPSADREPVRPEQLAPVPPMPAESARQPSRQPTETTGVGFLPVPNGGDAAFERKYAGKTPAELNEIGQRLRVVLNDEFETLANARRELGLLDQATAKADGNHPISPTDGKPVGMGRTQAMRWFGPGNGVTNVGTVWITEAESPDYFARCDEFNWVARHSVAPSPQTAQGGK